MGAAAFVMAEFMGVSYAQVVIWALIPAVLYYVACFWAVHFEAKRLGLTGVPRAELPKMGAVLREQGTSVHPGRDHPDGDVFRLQRAARGARRHAACFPVAALRATSRQRDWTI